MARRETNEWSLERERLTILDCHVANEEFQPHRRDIASRLERKIRDKLNCKTDDLLPTRRHRMRRNKRRANKNVMDYPRKILGSRFRKR